MKVPPSFFEITKDVATSPYALLAYLVLIIAWAIIYLRTNRLKVISNSIKNLPESERRAMLERDYGYYLKEGMTSAHFLKAQRQAYFFYGVITVIVMLAIIVITAEIHVFNPTKNQILPDQDSYSLIIPLNKIISAMDNGFKSIKGDLNEDDSGGDCAVYNSLITIPNTTFNEIVCCGDRPTFKTTIYHGKDKSIARGKYLDFVTDFEKYYPEWKLIEQKPAAENNSNYFSSFLKQDKRLTIINEPDEKQDSYWIMIMIQ